MGLKDAEALRSFCLELSSSDPAPGGGSASAAAGAMAASLLVMVCSITAKSKKHASKKDQLEEQISMLADRRDNLVELAREDARAYDLVVDSFRRHRVEGTETTARGVDEALMYAAEIPLRTAGECIGVLESSVKVAELGVRNASSDVGVAVHLAEAGFKGASMNVRINLKEIKDREFVLLAEDRLSMYDQRAKDLVRDAMERLGKDSRE